MGAPAAKVEYLFSDDLSLPEGREPIEYTLELWHGVGLPLVLSALVLVVGIAAFFSRERLGRARLSNWRPLGNADRVYDAVVRGDAEKLFDIDQSKGHPFEAFIDKTDRLRTAGWHASRIFTGATASYHRAFYHHAGGVEFFFNGRPRAPRTGGAVVDDYESFDLR